MRGKITANAKNMRNLPYSIAGRCNFLPQVINQSAKPINNCLKEVHFMGRYIKEFTMHGTEEQIYGTISQYLLTQGYIETVYKGEKLLKKPDTFSTGPIFFKVSFLTNNKIRIESWMKRALVPGGAYIGEIAPDDIQGWACKGPWKNCIGHIEYMLDGAAVSTSPEKSTSEPECLSVELNTSGIHKNVSDMSQNPFCSN